MNVCIPLCNHVKGDGVRCGSPAMRGRRYCYFHNRYYQGTAIRLSVPDRDFPMLTNRRNIQTALTSLLRYAAEGRIAKDNAHELLNAIVLANNLVKSPRK